jgi:hypothetical protein
MGIRSRTTQATNASAGTLFEVTTDCSNYPHPDDLSTAAGLRAATASARTDRGAGLQHGRFMTRSA